MDENEIHTFTSDQFLMLNRYTLPEDLNKYIVEMAEYLFSTDELKTITAANLDPTKIAFMSSKFF